MSFLNPVNEPVKRFSSTDAGAPQINYNVRVAGDVKAVLRACLVTGYGTKASAGWSIASEVNHVIEFASPSAAMSDYRICIDDTSTTSQTWFYRYQNNAFYPPKNAPSKNMSSVNKTSAENGWELIVTNRGMYFVEILYHSTVNARVARITWFGQIKSALANDLGVNISFFCTGIGAQMTKPSDLITASESIDSNKLYNLGTYPALIFVITNLSSFARDSTVKYDTGGLELISETYLGLANLVAGQQSGLLFKNNSILATAYGVSVQQLDGRDVLSVAVSYSSMSDVPTNNTHVKTLLIRLDYWEY